MISFQEVCLMYCGEKDITNLDKDQLLYCMRIYEGLVGLDKSVQDKKLEISELHKELNDECLIKKYNELEEKYQHLYDKWEQFSRCLDMGPEKFISMLDDLKEKIKSKGNEIAHLREQLKTSELDAKRYKNDGIQDRVKLQEVVVQLESMTKMRDDWKVDCEDARKCLQEEKTRRWELEEEVEKLKNQIQSLIDEVCPKQKIDLSSYVKSKKELDELVEKRLSVFEKPTLHVIGNDIDGYHNIYVNFVDELVFVDNVKNNLSSLKDSLVLVEFSAIYAIKNIENGNYLYTIYKSNRNVEKLTHIELEHLEYNICNCCECAKKKGKKIHTRIYFTTGAERILVDTVPFEVNYWHYNICEDSTKTRYVIARKDPVQKDLHNYSIDKQTLKVKVID